MKALLPTVPIKYVETVGKTGTYAARTWYSKTIGDVSDAHTYRNYLPGQSNIFDDGSTGTSTHLSFQQYNAKKFKLRQTTTFTLQNTANTTMIMTAHIAKIRRDMIDDDPYVGDYLYKDCSATANAATGEYLIDKASAVPASSYIGNFYNYPQFTMFSSTNACATWKVVKTRKLRIPAGGWVKFKLNTGYKEFDSKWLTENASQTNPIRHLRDWSKTLILTWHGELVQKIDDVTTNTLSKTDFMMYMTHSLTLKAVPYHRQSILYKVPVGLSSGTTLGFTPQVRPTVIVQVTKTDADADDDAQA